VRCLNRVKSRLNTESGISFTEFSYQLLQAYDFAILHRDHGCHIQLGGSDQWGNIVAGIDLIKRQKAGIEVKAQVQDQGPDMEVEEKQSEEKQTEEKQPEEKQADEKEKEVDDIFGLTTPLLTAANGEKFGKSAGNAIWLDESQTSVSDFYQVSILLLSFGLKENLA